MTHPRPSLAPAPDVCLSPSSGFEADHCCNHFPITAARVAICQAPKRRCTGSGVEGGTKFGFWKYRSDSSESGLE